MGIGTGGTTASTSLTALKCPGSFITPTGVVFSNTQLDADIATINNSLRDDFLPAGAPVYQPSMGLFSRKGQLFVPNRGWLKVFPGDCVMVDANGWPILISGKSVAGAPWVTTAT